MLPRSTFPASQRQTGMEHPSLAPLNLESFGYSLEDSSTLSGHTEASGPGSLPTFQLFRDKKVTNLHLCSPPCAQLRVEESVAYQHRVVLGGSRLPLPWLPGHSSHLQDWAVGLPGVYSIGGQVGGRPGRVRDTGTCCRRGSWRNC